MQITAIVAPFHPDASRPNLVTPRASDGVDEFIGAVGAAAGAETHVIEGSLCDAPAEGFLILFSAEGLAEHPQLSSRAVLINIDRTMVREELERLRPLAAIEEVRYLQWQHEREGETGYGLLGQKSLASAIGAELAGGPFTTPSYGMLESEAYRSLPEVLGAYLRAADTPTRK